MCCRVMRSQCFIGAVFEILPLVSHTVFDRNYTQQSSLRARIFLISYPFRCGPLRVLDSECIAGSITSIWPTAAIALLRAFRFDIVDVKVDHEYQSPWLKGITILSNSPQRSAGLFPLCLTHRSTLDSCVPCSNGASIECRPLRPCSALQCWGCFPRLPKGTAEGRSCSIEKARKLD